MKITNDLVNLLLLGLVAVSMCSLFSGVVLLFDLGEKYNFNIFKGKNKKKKKILGVIFIIVFFAIIALEEAVKILYFEKEIREIILKKWEKY